MKKIFLFLFLTIFFLPFESDAQLVVGIGPQYTVPVSRFAERNENSFGGTAFIESRKYCNLWPALRLDYLYLTPKDTLNFPEYYTQAIIFSPEAKIFFWQPTDVPLYVQAQLMISGISGKDENSRLGLGAALGAGYLLFYDSNCASWFLDLNARYMAPNFILKDDKRPSLNVVNVNLTLNFGL